MTHTYNRWYDHDPLLMQVIELLKSYPNELKSQAESFLKKVEEQVSKEAVDRFYDMVKPMILGNRWYDHDPVLSKTVELLRVVPQEIQKLAADNFISALKESGVEVSNSLEGEDDP